MEVINTLKVELQNLKSLYHKLKCSRCGKLLSVFPVYYRADVGNICGRCTKDLDEMISTGWLQPATTYELVAKELKFPCCNNHIGCRDLLKWNVVVEHENKCRGRLLCELSDCPAKGIILTNHELIEHFFNCHKEQYRKHPLKIELYEMSRISDIFFTKVFNRVFLVEITRRSVSVKCVHIDHGNEHEFYNFEVEVLHRKGWRTAVGSMETNSLLSKDIHKKQIIDIVRYSPDEECNISIIQKSKNAIATIEKKFSIITSSEKQKVENAINKFKNDNQLTLDSMVPLHSAIIATKLALTDTNLLNELDCPICVNYMRAPIFSCSTGHSICKDCKEKINACPTCRAPIGNTRNYTLESLADQFIMPCRFKEFGCQVILKEADIEQHILNDCLYKTVKCPFVNCDMLIRLANTTNHFMDNHVRSIFKAGDVLRKVLTKQASCDYLILTNDVFVLRFDHEDNSFPSVKFDCLHIDLHNTKENYAFELKFINQTNNNLILVIKQMCKSKFADFGNDSLVLPIGSLKSYITNEPNSALCFQCFIHKC